MDNLESRIRALEASNRRQRYSITALAAIIVGGAFIAATRPAGDATFDSLTCNLITCKESHVVDRDGKLRIGVGSDGSGATAMIWYDKDGKNRMSAGTEANGDAGMSWHDKDGKRRISAITYADGYARMAWFDKDGKPRIAADTAPSGGMAGICLIDKDGKTRIRANTFADGTANLPTTDLKPNP